MRHFRFSLVEMRRDRPQERAASWPAEHIKVLLALWTEAAVTHDLSSHGRNRAVYDGISQRLAEMGIYRTGDQCREKMKGLKVAYRKAKENNSVGRPPIKCPFYDEIDQIMTQYINCRPGFPSEVGEGSSVTADRQEGVSISEPWGAQSSISERWGSQASGHWLSQTAASESQGTDEFSYTQAETQEAFGEIQVIPVQVKEEESEGEISPELDVASPMLMEIQPPPRQLISMLDQRPHLRTRKQKVQGDGQSRGAGQKCSRSHQQELQRMQKQVAIQAEEKQSLAEFIQHDKEMRREDREFQAQLFEKLFQKQTELVQVLTQQSPASPNSAACANPMQTLQMATKNGAGTAAGTSSALQALLEQIMQSDLSGKSLNRLAVKEALGGRVKVPPEVQYWTAEEILRWLLSQQPPADHCQEMLSGPRLPFHAGHLGGTGKGDHSEAHLSIRVTSDNMVVDSPREDLNEDQRQPCIKDSRENPRKVGLLGTETHLQLRKRARSDPREQIVPKQDGEHGVAAAKQMKLDNSIEEQEMLETGKKAKEMPTSRPGKQAGKAKGRGRSVPSYNVTGESQTEGDAKMKSSGRVSEAVNGIKHEQKASASLGPSQLAFDKDATVSSPQPGHDGHGSPDIDRPSFSDSIDILLDSPWSGNGSGDTAQDRGPGSRMLPPCLGCTVLKAELDTVREELRLTQASTLYGLSGSSLQDISEALGTVVRILNNTKSLPGTNTSQNIAEIPSRPVWRERNGRFTVQCHCKFGLLQTASMMAGREDSLGTES
ncbi:hypothetical protein NXF25_015110 [Crotalus adamanteus]|uniref:Myb/SANT-like DNA-binding domain-containing protein n=1 Tax=Crotalus adamanteus TaxID=8729 RepID=A0AAW1AXV0_CROAD